MAKTFVDPEEERQAYANLAGAQLRKALGPGPITPAAAEQVGFPGAEAAPEAVAVADQLRRAVGPAPQRVPVVPQQQAQPRQRFPGGTVLPGQRVQVHDFGTMQAARANVARQTQVDRLEVLREASRLKIAEGRAAGEVDIDVFAGKAKVDPETAKQNRKMYKNIASGKLDLARDQFEQNKIESDRTHALNERRVKDLEDKQTAAVADKVLTRKLVRSTTKMKGWQAELGDISDEEQSLFKQLLDIEVATDDAGKTQNAKDRKIMGDKLKDLAERRKEIQGKLKTEYEKHEDKEPGAVAAPAAQDIVVPQQVPEVVVPRQAPATAVVPATKQDFKAALKSMKESGTAPYKMAQFTPAQKKQLKAAYDKFRKGANK